ncbi:hypothetical protein MHYP_G00004830 [Metynnis hypsauchen]
MSQPAKLRVILEDHDIRKLTLPSGIPPSVENLKSKVQEAFGVQGEFALQYMDNDFGGQFFTLCSTDAIQDKDTIKVIYLAAPVEPPSCSDSDASEIVTLTLYEDTACSSSGSSADTVLLSPDRRSERSVPWPSEFPIPRFAYNTELILERGNESYLKDGSLLSAPSIKTDILEKLAETIYQYIKEEFLRITTLHLESKFMLLLDQYTPKLLCIFTAKGGAAGRRIRGIMSCLHKGECSIEKRREVIIRSLMEYVGEHGLFTECFDVARAERASDFSQQTMNIFIVKKDGASEDDDYEDIGIVLEGQEGSHTAADVRL